MKQVDIATIAPDKAGLTTPNDQADGKGRSAECFGNWQFNLETRRLSLSPRARNLLGLAQGGNYKIAALFRLIDPECFEKAKAWLRMAGKGGVLEQVVLNIHPINNKAFWIKLSGFHYAERWEVPKMIIGVMEDYTQNVNEEQIALSIVNHELRTPLSVIKLNAQMIQKAGNPYVPVTHAQMAGSIESHTDGIIRLLEQYLSGPAAMHTDRYVVFDVNKVTRQIINDMEYLYKDHKFIHLCSGQAFVRGDKYQILQVLINYLTNAVKYSPAGTEIIVEVITDQQQVSVCVTDHGQGIAAGLEERVFDRFFRSGKPTVADTSSKGLGLYLVRQIIEGHGGKAWAERGAVDGTVFFFQLPSHEETSLSSSLMNSVNLISDIELIRVNNAD